MDWSVWNVVGSILQIFSRIGSGSAATSGGAPPTSNAVVESALYFQEKTPLVERMISEIQTGWSMQTVYDFWGPLLQIPVLIVLTFGTSIVYCSIRVMQIRRAEEAAFRAYAATTTHDAPREQLRWQRVLEQASSGDVQMWRNAILEADQMLNELLDTLGYKGETIGDKMRKADVSAFNTIDFAWEAHQVRNRIVQDLTFVPDASEVKRVIKMYERVFEEFHFIGGGHQDHHHGESHH